MTTKDLYLKAYTQHKSNAKTRGVDFLFAFEQWRDWWVATGIWTSAVEAARCIGIPKPTVEWRCRNNFLGFSYLAIA